MISVKLKDLLLISLCSCQCVQRVNEQPRQPAQESLILVVKSSLQLSGPVQTALVILDLLSGFRATSAGRRQSGVSD